MKNNSIRKNIGALVVCVLCLTAGCKKSVVEKNEIQAQNFGDTLSMQLNTCVELSLESTKSNDELTVCLQTIRDNRCYWSDCNLCFGSTAEIDLLLISGEDTTSTAASLVGCLQEDRCSDNYLIEINGYSICFMNLIPYPERDIPVADSDYLAKVKIEKL